MRMSAQSAKIEAGSARRRAFSIKKPQNQLLEVPCGQSPANRSTAFQAGLWLVTGR